MALCLNCKTPGCDSKSCDPRERDALALYNTLLPLQQRAMWYLAKFMGETELQCIAEDFLLAQKYDKSETVIDPPTLKDMVQFYFHR